MTKKIIIANWKMHKDHTEAQEFLESIKFTQFGNEIVICPPFTLLGDMQNGENFSLGAQDCSSLSDDKGAFTGDISAKMLKLLNCKYVILGHSERRSFHKEDNLQINKKIINAINQDIIPILCVGESQDERANGNYLTFLENSIESTIPKEFDEDKFIIAYEPLWSIGSGKAATITQIEEVHNFLSKIIRTRFAKKVKIIYGGSVNLDNASDITKIDNVDGLLIGGASLNPETFRQIALTTER